MASSETFIRWVLPNSVKMLSGWSAAIGSASADGYVPSMIAGWARSVESCTVYALRNHVADRSRAANAG